jgi:hypothetical protein
VWLLVALQSIFLEILGKLLVSSQSVEFVVAAFDGDRSFPWLFI